MLKHSDAAADARVLLSDGSEVLLSELWKEDNIALVFLRHFG